MKKRCKVNSRVAGAQHHGNSQSFELQRAARGERCRSEVAGNTGGAQHYCKGREQGTQKKERISAPRR